MGLKRSRFSSMSPAPLFASPVEQRLRRVGHLIKGLGRGGAELLLPQLIRVSRFREPRVAYFLPWKNALVDDLTEAGASVRCLSARSALGMALRIPSTALWIRREKLALVHAHLPLAGVVARIAGRLAGVPVVYSEHNLQERYHAATRWANRATWRWQTRVVAVSAEVAGSIGERIGGQVPVRVVRNGIDVDAKTPGETDRVRCRSLLGIPDEVPVVGAVGVFRVQKRFDRWIEVAVAVRKRNPLVRFVLVGDGPLREELERQACESGLGDALIFPGLQEDVTPYLAAMDLFLITSRHEGLPLALLEAMAAGVPVVSTAVGGIPEVVRDGVNGRLVPSGSVETLTSTLCDLLDSPSSRRELACMATETVKREFSIERMAAELDAVYDEVLSGAAS